MSSSDPTSRPLPDWLLERYALGELPPERLESLRVQIEADPALSARLRNLRNHDRAVLLQHPPRRVADQIRQRAGLSTAGRRRSVGWTALPVLLVAAAALLFVRPSSLPMPDVLPKGDEAVAVIADAPELRIFRAEDGELEPGARAVAGDVLGFRYHAQGRAFGALLSIDGAGAVTVHLPRSAGDSLELEPGLVTIDLGYELDDAPGFERFFLVLTDTPFELGHVLEAAHSLAAGESEHAPLELGRDFQVIDFVLDKEAG